MTGSRLYRMTVTHRRLRAPRHAFRTRITALLLDLDAVGEVAAACRLFSVDRRNLVSFHAADHGDGVTRDLRAWFEATCRAAGVAPPGGRLLLLAMPRVLGRCFNPLSVFFAYGADGELGAILYAVRNTFGGRHAYVVPVAAGAALRHGAEKCFHVSPFMPAALRYRFAVDLPEPGDAGPLRVCVDACDRVSGERMIATVMGGRARAITDRGLLAAAFRMPLQGIAVLARIHLEAARLWWKGARPLATPPDAAHSTASAGC